MKTVTYEEFLKFNPRLEAGEVEQIKAYFDCFGGKMSASDILKLENMRSEDKLFVVSHEEFIPAPILHELSCVCAEYALSLVKEPDPRSIDAIKVKRAWIHGEATDEELTAAYTAARDVTYDAPSRTAYWTAQAAVEAAWAGYDTAYWAACNNACVTTEAAVFDAMVTYLIMALEEEV